MIKKLLTLDFAHGYKTYFVGALLFVLGGLKALGKIDEATYDTLFKALVGLGLITLRQGVKNEFYY